MNVYIEDLATHPEEIQKELQQAVEAAQPKNIGKDGLLRLIVQGIVYIGRLVLTGKLKVFKVERCEQVKPTAIASTATAKAKSKAAPKKSATASTATAKAKSKAAPKKRLPLLPQALPSKPAKRSK